MGNSGLLWKILIVENRFINEIIDKVDHSSVANFCKNKGQNACFHFVRFAHYIPASV